MKPINLGPEEGKWSSNDVKLRAFIGIPAFIIFPLIIYIIWLHGRGE